MKFLWKKRRKFVTETRVREPTAYTASTCSVHGSPKRIHNVGTSGICRCRRAGVPESVHNSVVTNGEPASSPPPLYTGSHEKEEPRQLWTRILEKPSPALLAAHHRRGMGRVVTKQKLRSNRAGSTGAIRSGAEVERIAGESSGANARLHLIGNFPLCVYFFLKITRGKKNTELNHSKMLPPPGQWFPHLATL